MNWGDTRIQVGGVDLECLCLGPPPDTAPTLVLLHEGLGCTAMWRDFPERLVDDTGYGVFAYSRAGYGASDPVSLPRPLDYMTREALEFVPNVLDAAEITNCVLVGHSDGATIAAIHAGQVHDARVNGVVLIAPHFFTEPDGLASIRAARKAFDDGHLRAGLARYHTDPDVAFRGWCDAWLDPDFRSWNVEHVLNTIQIPILAVQGTQDQYGSARQIETIRDRAPGPVTLHLIDKCGHSPHRECPAHLSRLIADNVSDDLTPQDDYSVRSLT